ncbi:hypothetical protein ATE49_15185 [Elizabethkingia miricola]|uniref:Uncharacterized protein n=2 Tax=Elizabethkingia TaxID=308865 RepID=A0ABY3NBI4_ELIMR|nr:MULTISPECIES: hypothetical protein [Elizabethkingia]AQX00422.1 hypothetical protein BBD32_02555 [Elizabethkingia anophelis]OBS12993.1 hypothetical protein ATE49_15185 [Elizabethkingia miricola]OPB66190.1 hypothetical protein BAY11_14585 [Elizabethkingia anophelis]TYO84210.1 hypothetical protein LX74_04010 [Elizabethkingia miricola]
MRKTVLDGKQWIFELLKNGGIKNVISGDIYKDRRPVGSTKEDAVINSISMNEEFLQDGVFNINIYIPYLRVKINGIDQDMPNEVRQKIIMNFVKPLLESVYTKDYNLKLEFHDVLDDAKDNWINFRVNMKAFNNN